MLQARVEKMFHDSKLADDEPKAKERLDGQRGVQNLKSWFRKLKRGLRKLWVRNSNVGSETGFQKLERWVSATRQLCSAIVVRQLGRWVSATGNIGPGNWETKRSMRNGRHYPRPTLPPHPQYPLQNR